MVNVCINLKKYLIYKNNFSFVGLIKNIEEILDNEST